MPFDWSSLCTHAPASLAAARVIAHHAAQWPARAACANLASRGDDSHATLSWHRDIGALLTQTLPGDTRVGLRMQGPALLFMRKEAIDESFALARSTAAEAHRWLDHKLEHAGLKRASGVQLDYGVQMPDYGQAAREAPQLAALAGWYAAMAELLEEQRGKYARHRASPVRCEPRSMRLGFTLALGPARSIRIGLSAGDRHFAEPYAYVSPHPRPERAWHERGFFAATATELLALPDPRQGLVDFIDVAFEAASRVAALARVRLLQPPPMRAPRPEHEWRE